MYCLAGRCFIKCALKRLNIAIKFNISENLPSVCLVPPPPNFPCGDAFFSCAEIANINGFHKPAIPMLRQWLLPTYLVCLSVCVTADGIWGLRVTIIRIYTYRHIVLLRFCIFQFSWGKCPVCPCFSFVTGTLVEQHIFCNWICTGCCT